MTLTQELRQKYDKLWHAMTHHRFVAELGNGTLPVEVFKRYFLQDYVFVNDLVSMTALGISKAPDFHAANVLNQFLTGILNPENDLFVRAFEQLGASETEYAAASATPVTQGFGDFLMRVGLEGAFEDIITALYVTEGTYLDWGARLLNEGKRPSNPIYREWIEIHGPAVLGDLVSWMQEYLDRADIGSRRPRIERIFRTALRYEFLFWEAAYYNLPWPDEQI
ncbi:MAG: TenA family protein [Chloroflexi bacterium]|nr:TenA family protein [Chloroflexota bacterium]